MFVVHDIANWQAQRPETLGTKEKQWMLPPKSHPMYPTPYIFKVGRPGTGENWSEKAACEIGKYLGLPTAEYELAVYDGERGVISPRFFPDSARLFPANTLLAQVIVSYDGEKRFKQISYSLHNVIRFFKAASKSDLGSAHLQCPLGTSTDLIDRTALNIFIGYLFLDALIVNTDRHHENWGVVIDISPDAVAYHLAPTFDHASCLGRNETLDRLRERLQTRDLRSCVEAYADRGRSAFYGRGETARTMTHREIVQELLRTCPEEAKFWGTRVASLAPENFMGILSQISPEWISEEAVTFALRMLRNQQRMVEELTHG